eukprot:UN03986
MQITITYCYTLISSKRLSTISFLYNLTIFKIPISIYYKAQQLFHCIFNNDLINIYIQYYIQSYMKACIYNINFNTSALKPNFSFY